MKFTLPDGAFPVMRLSKTRQAALTQEAETVVSETIAANEAFRAKGATFQSLKWRLVRVKEGLHVYHQRDVQVALETTPRSSRRFRARVGSRKALGIEANEETPLSPSSAVSENGIQDQMRRPGISLMALHGTVDGTLEDSMFGAFAATDQAWKWRSSHVNDRLDDARILATVHGPTKKDPFRFLGIKWFAKEHPTVLTGILQRRDFLIMEATGLRTDSKGEKVGYFLMHSVTLRAAPELSELGILRGELSFCFLLRQSGPGKVELYCRGFSDPRGDMMERVSVAIAAEALICSAGVVDYAYIKKLTWFMKHKGGQLAGREGRPSRCESCNKSFTKFGFLAVAAGTATTGSASCQICRRVVCAKCSVVKKMTVNVSDKGVVKQCSLRFCLGCLLEAKQKSAWEMAIDGVEAAPQTPSTSGSSSGTPHSRFVSMPHKVNRRRDGRSYSEYQRAGTRVYRQGAMATEFSRINPSNQVDNVDSSDRLDQQRRGGNSRMGDRFQTAPGGRSTQVLLGDETSLMYQTQSPPESSNGAIPVRHSERPKSLRDMRFRTMK